eukprot:CAMPEP_0185435920 /NCGR_PEP_ID=MMETSP1365-20130426/26125_1 /TAXON_ID=38817 /ORGANISM="Gephyrocapsa oceanica, Strain RCC1303" /LENGTH=89 /DNA_ID=CAMNT_0028040621 /DNA_START=1 /DNA_END=267 /DNA_ORIENTATION=+
MFVVLLVVAARTLGAPRRAVRVLSLRLRRRRRRLSLSSPLSLARLLTNPRGAAVLLLASGGPPAAALPALSPSHTGRLLGELSPEAMIH